MIVEGLTTTDAALVAAVALIAGMMRGFTGFGAALMLAPVLAYAVGPRAAIPAILIVMLVTSVQLVPRAWKSTNWSVVTPLAVGGSIGVPLGAWLLISIDPELMRRGISLTVIVLALLMLAGWRYRGQVRASVAAMVGVMGGFISGAAAAGGPPVILFLLSGPENAARNRAAIIMYFALVQVAAFVVYAVADLITLQTVLLSLPMIPTIVIGTWLGERLFGKASETLYRRIALVVLLAIGLSTLFA